MDSKTPANHAQRNKESSLYLLVTQLLTYIQINFSYTINLIHFNVLIIWIIVNSKAIQK